MTRSKGIRPYLPRGATLAQRLAARSIRDNLTGCLVWTGWRYDSDQPYGRIAVDGRRVVIHKAAWELVNGPVPLGKVLRHSCDTPPCFELSHLVLGTQAENVRDMFDRGRVDRCGERNNSARLTWEVVRELRAAYESGASVKELAVRFSISKSQVRNITSGRHWAEVA